MKISAYRNVVLTSLSLLTAVPNIGTCFPAQEFPLSKNFSEYDLLVNELVEQAYIGNASRVQELLQEVAETLKGSTNVLGDSRQFLQKLVDGMNARFGSALTLSDIIEATRESAHMFQIPEADEADYLEGLNWLDGEDPEDTTLESDISKKHMKKSQKNVWDWLIVTSITIGAVAVCVYAPGVAITAFKVVVGAIDVLLINKK